MNSNTLAYLSKYRKAPALVSLSDLSAQQIENLPANWISLLEVSSQARIIKTLELWRPFQYELPELFNFLKTNLVSVDLLSTRDTVSLLYGIQGAERIVYYEGRNPQIKCVPETLRQIWEQLPEKFVSFYNVLHNGFFYLASESMGLSPVENFSFLSEHEWGILEEIEPISFSLEKIITIFSNGMGGYVCLDIEKPANSLIWWHDEEPELNIELWPVIDAWTVLGMES